MWSKTKTNCKYIIPFATSVKVYKYSETVHASGLLLNEEKPSHPTEIERVFNIFSKQLKISFLYNNKNEITDKIVCFSICQRFAAAVLFVLLHSTNHEIDLQIYIKILFFLHILLDSSLARSMCAWHMRKKVEKKLCHCQVVIVHFFLFTSNSRAHLNLRILFHS